MHIWDLSRSFGKISVQEGRRFIGQIGACKCVTSGLVYAVPAWESRLKSGSNVGGVLLIPKQRMDKRLEERQEVPPAYLVFLGVVRQSRESASASELGAANDDRRGGGLGDEQVGWVRVAHLLWTIRQKSQFRWTPCDRPAVGAPALYC